MILLLITYALFASVFTVGKVALEVAPPFFLTAFRYTVAGVFLCFVAAFRGFFFKWRILPHLVDLVVIGVFGVFLTNGLEFWGLQFLTSAKTCLVYSLSPFFSILFSYLFLKERMTVRKFLGLFVGLIGFAILFMGKDPVDSSEVFLSVGPISIAEIVVFFSSAATVIGWIFFKKLMRFKGFPISLANGYSFLIGGGIAAFVSWFFEPFPSFQQEQLFGSSWQIAYITVVHSLICYTLYAYALQRFSVTFVMFVGITNPFFTAIYGWFFLGESITPEFVYCLLLVGIGLYLFYLEERREKKQELY